MGMNGSLPYPFVGMMGMRETVVENSKLNHQRGTANCAFAS
jgi:hypothetical protein